MTTTVVGLFDNMPAAQDTARDLVDSGFRRDDISVVASDPTGEHARRFAAGANGGAAAALGGLGGLLVGLVSLAIPGTGPVVAAGPLAATLAGAGMGAVAGGLAGALHDDGLPEDDARTFAEGVRSGRTLLTVRAERQIAGHAREILSHHGAADIALRASELPASSWQEDELEHDDTANTANDDQERDAQPDAPYSTSPLEIDEQIEPQRVDSAYGGAEFKNVERAGTEFVQEPDLPVDEQGVGLSSGAGQTGAGHQAGPAAEAPDFQKHYDLVYSHTGAGYEHYVPAYRFGYDMGRDSQYYGRRWTEIEPGLRRDWETRHAPGSWDAYREAVRHGWERGSSSGSAAQPNAEGNAGEQPSRLNRPSYQGPEDRRI